ncbi:MAG: hypothetical protein OEV85_05615 [Candidatus Thorarchaeota archaeon]|nr:hypothetical protein [Candidatus Thorarchaeota archaeon]
MGAAIDSFVMAIEIAGSLGILALIWSFITRLRTQPRKRGVFQRLPVLLSAVVFIISIIIIGQLGILPIAEYKGTNQLNRYVTSGEILHFNVYESNIAYSENIEMRLDTYLMPSETINNTIEFYLGDSLIDMIYINLSSAGVENTVTEERILDLEPGLYIVRINHTFYEDGIPDDTLAHWERFTLTQAVKSSFIQELVSWSSLQFGLNIGCFFLLLGGFCVGTSKPRYTTEDTYEEPQTDFGDGGPEYGKGC